MDFILFKSIKSQHYKWNRIQCLAFANRHLDTIKKKYPDGNILPPNTYFVLPGYEHMTKFQPIIVFDSIENIFILSTNTVFFTPSIILKD